MPEPYPPDPYPPDPYSPDPYPPDPYSPDPYPPDPYPPDPYPPDPYPLISPEPISAILPKPLNPSVSMKKFDAHIASVSRDGRKQNFFNLLSFLINLCSLYRFPPIPIPIS